MHLTLRWLVDRLLRRARLDREMEEEIRSHLDFRAAELEEAGRSPGEASRQARLEFGGIENYKEQCRETRRFHLLHDFVADLRYGLRMLRKSPGFTFVAVITLALGIGANTAIFSVLNGWLLRPLPVRAPEEITVVAPEPDGKFSYRNFVDFQKQVRTFSEDVFAYAPGVAGLRANGYATEFTYSSVTGNYFSALGVKPVVGRLFLPGEGERPNGELLLVLGYSYWQKRFAGDPNVAGTQVLVNGAPATVIGVVPKEFQGTFFAMEMDGYLPLSMLSRGRAETFWTDRGDRELFVLGRLKPGVSRAQAQSAVDVIAGRLAAQSAVTDKGMRIRVIPERLARPAAFVTSYVPVIVALFLVLPGVVLLLACINLANLLLLRAAGRQREFGIRAALGAGRARLTRQILTETLLLVFLAAGLGVALGQWAIAFSGTLLHSAITTSSNFGYKLDCSLDWRVFAFALLIAGFAAIPVGVWPAVRCGGRHRNPVLQGHMWSSSMYPPNPRLRSALVLAQVAGSLTLLIITGLFVRTLNRAARMDLGFDPGHVVNVMLDTTQAGYDQRRTDQFYRDLKERVRALPGVESASTAFAAPLTLPSGTAAIYVEGHPLAPSERAQEISFNSIDPEYPRTMRIPLLRGRMFTAADDGAARRVAVVNQSMAKRFWPDQDAVGKRFRVESATTSPIEIVGIVPDGQSTWRLSLDPQSFFYVPLAQNYSPLRSLQVRTSGPPEPLVAVVQEEIRKLSPDVPVIDCRTMQQAVNGLAGLFVFRLAASLAGIMGILGLVLATIGVSGVAAYSSRTRTHEIGVRVALGAQRRDVLRLVAQQGLKVVAAGILVGLGAAAALTSVARKLFLGVSPTDPLTYVAVSILLAVLALTACWIPAWRATKIDPIAVLRCE